MPRLLRVAAVALVVVLAVVGTVAAQSGQRFSDVPPDHPDSAAVEWAASVGITSGYGDGTFRPEEPLSFRHATVFLARYYGDVLGADVSADFTRSDMMRVLHEMAGTPGQASSPAEGTEAPESEPDEPGEPEERPGSVPTWSGTSTYNGAAAAVVCGRGPAEFAWNLDDGGSPLRWLTVLIWSPPAQNLAIDVAGANGASTRLFGAHGDAAFLSFGSDAGAHIGAGRATFSVVPSAGDAVWGLAGIRSSQVDPLWSTSGPRQQWAQSVACDTTG